MGIKENDVIIGLTPRWVIGLFLALSIPTAHAILAGGEFDLPADSPSNRLDTEGIYSWVQLKSMGQVFK